MKARDKQRRAVARRLARRRRKESPPLRAAWARECADRAAEAKGQMTEWFVMEQPGRTVLLRPEFSLPQARRAWFQQVRTARAVFAQACSQEPLAHVLA